MKSYYLFTILILLIPGSWAEEYKCDNAGKTDSSDCLQKLINTSTLQNKAVLFEPGSYLITKPLIIPSNSTISGNHTKIFLKNDGTFLLKNVTNVSISNLSLDGGGRFLNSQIPNPIRQEQFPYIIGFSNSIAGVFIQGNANNIRIINNLLSNMDFGVRVISDQTGFINNLTVSNNKILNIGAEGVSIINGSNISIIRNNIRNVLGNIAGGKVAMLSDSKFADGIYLNGVIHAKILQNSIENVIRIAIVLEGSDTTSASDPGLVNDDVFIEGNVIRNVNGSRGTECNAGIWVEPAASAKEPLKVKTNTVTIKNNVIDNKGAKPGVHIQYGLFLGAKHSIVQNNQISNFTNTNEKNFLNTGFHDVKSSGGIYCVYGYAELLNNKLTNNNVGILFNPTAYYSAYKLQDNVISGSKYFMYYPGIKYSAGIKAGQ